MTAIMWLFTCLLWPFLTYGSSKMLESVQMVGEVIENELDCGTIVGFSSLDAHLLLAVSPAYDLVDTVDEPVLLQKLHRTLVGGFVGLSIDTKIALQLAKEEALTYFGDMLEDIPQGYLSLNLANDIYDRSRSNRAPLIYNAMFMGTGAGRDEKQRGRKPIGLMKVDQSAAFYRCSADAIGQDASKLTQWLTTHKDLLTKDGETKQKSSHKVTDLNEINRLLQIGLDCLHENFHGSCKLDLDNAKVEVCLAYFPDLNLLENRKFAGPPGLAAEPRIIGPLVVPQALLNNRDAKEWKRFLLKE
jgi:hypothetical protein